MEDDMDEVQPGPGQLDAADATDVEDAAVMGDVTELLAALEAADSQPLEDRLALLRRTEAHIAGALEGLDGL